MFMKGVASSTVLVCDHRIARLAVSKLKAHSATQSAMIARKKIGGGGGGDASVFVQSRIAPSEIGDEVSKSSFASHIVSPPSDQRAVVLAQSKLNRQSANAADTLSPPRQVLRIRHERVGSDAQPPPISSDTPPPMSPSEAISPISPDSDNSPDDVNNLPGSLPNSDLPPTHKPARMIRPSSIQNLASMTRNENGGSVDLISTAPVSFANVVSTINGDATITPSRRMTRPLFTDASIRVTVSSGTDAQAGEAVVTPLNNAAAASPKHLNFIKIVATNNRRGTHSTAMNPSRAAKTHEHTGNNTAAEASPTASTPAVRSQQEIAEENMAELTAFSQRLQRHNFSNVFVVSSWVIINSLFAWIPLLRSFVPYVLPLQTLVTVMAIRTFLYTLNSPKKKAAATTDPSHASHTDVSRTHPTQTRSATAGTHTAGKPEVVLEAAATAAPTTQSPIVAGHARATSYTPSHQPTTGGFITAATRATAQTTLIDT